jgi:hypothetical protein
MARKPPVVPGEFNPGDIPMSAGSGPQLVPQQKPQQQPEPTYSEQEVINHSELVRLQSRKETVLKMLHEEALSKNQVYLANTLAFIMSDYKFIQLNASQEEQQEQ